MEEDLNTTLVCRDVEDTEQAESTSLITEAARVWLLSVLHRLLIRQTLVDLWRPQVAPPCSDLELVFSIMMNLWTQTGKKKKETENLNLQTTEPWIKAVYWTFFSFILTYFLNKDNNQ